MPELTVTFQGTNTDLDDFCSQHSYRDTVTDENGDSIINPETKANFFKRKIKEFVYESVRAKRASKAAEAARKVEVDKIINF